MEGDDEIDDEAIDWSLQNVSELCGTELEYSTVTSATRKSKKKECSFCSAQFFGGPNIIRQHLDARIGNRNVESPLPCD
jgi:hypothetical protein